MRIATKEVQLTKGEYFLNLVSGYVKRRRLTYAALIAGVVCLLCYDASDPFILALFGVAIFWPAFLLVYSWRQASSSENTIVYAKRRFELTDDFVRCDLSDGSHSEIRYGRITKAVKSRKHYLLHISKTQFICIPFRAFLSEEDMEAVDTLLRSKHLL